VIIHGGDYAFHINTAARLLTEISNRTDVKVRLAQHYIDPAKEDIKNAPLIVFTGHQAFTLTPEQREALKKYVDGGGMIWGDLAGGNFAFNDSFRTEMLQVFADGDTSKLTKLLPPHDVYTGKYPTDVVPPGDLGGNAPFEGIFTGDGTRLAVVITPNRYFSAMDNPSNPAYDRAVKVGVNIYLYAVAHYQKNNPGQ